MKQNAYFLALILLFNILSNCSTNRMGLFDFFRKKQNTVTPLQKSQDTFKVFSIEDDSLPAVGLINNQLVKSKLFINRCIGIGSSHDGMNPGK